jgi:predicted membrane protein
MTESYSVEAHLRIALRNAQILVVVGFVVGGLVGWALNHWGTARIGAGLGALVGVGLLGWFMRMYSLTRGLLHL